MVVGSTPAERAIFIGTSLMLRIEDLASLLEQHRDAATARVAEFSIGGRAFAFNSWPAIMGVVNLSADSWYRESVCLSADAAVQRARVLAAQGADIMISAPSPRWPMHSAQTMLRKNPSCFRLSTPSGARTFSSPWRRTSRR